MKNPALYWLLALCLFGSCIKRTMIPIKPPPSGTSTTDTSQAAKDTNYTVSWQTLISSAGEVSGFIQLSDGSFVLTGSASNDATVVRLDAARNTLWQKNLGGTYYSSGQSIVATPDGGFVVAGQTDANDGDATDNHGYLDGWVYKLDASGNVVWKHAMGGSTDEQFNNVILNSDGTIMLAGHTASNNGDVSGNHGGYDLWVVKLDASGNKLWSKTYGGSGDDNWGIIHATSDGGYVLTGNSQSTDGDIPGNSGGSDIVVLKLDANGNKQWVRNYGGPGMESNSETIVTADGGFVIAGATDENGGMVSGFHGGNYDYWVIKLTSNGTLVWQTTLGGSDDDEASGLIATSDGGYMVSGWTYSTDGDITVNHGDRDAWLVKLGSGGKKLWQNTYGGAGPEISAWLIPAADGGIVSGGFSGYIAWMFEIK